MRDLKRSKKLIEVADWRVLEDQDNEKEETKIPMVSRCPFDFVSSSELLLLLFLLLLFFLFVGLEKSEKRSDQEEWCELADEKEVEKKEEKEEEKKEVSCSPSMRREEKRREEKRNWWEIDEKLIRKTKEKLQKEMSSHLLSHTHLSLSPGNGFSPPKEKTKEKKRREGDERWEMRKRK